MTSKTTIIGISGKMRHGKDETCRLFIQSAQQCGHTAIVRRAFADALKEECAAIMERIMNCAEIAPLPMDASTPEGYSDIRVFLASLFCLFYAEEPICDTAGSDILLDWYVNDLPLYMRHYGTLPLFDSIIQPAQDPWIYTFNLPETKPLFRKLLQWYGTEYRRNLFGTNYWLDKMTEFMDAQEPGTLVIAPDTRFVNEAEFCRNHAGFLIRVWRPGLDDNSPHISEVALDDYPHFNLTIENKAGITELEQAVYHAFRLFQQWQGTPWHGIGHIVDPSTPILAMADGSRLPLNSGQVKMTGDWPT